MLNRTNFTIRDRISPVAEAQWLCARLWHPNKAYRAYITRRWKQFIHAKHGTTTYERPAVAFIKRAMQGA